MVKTRVLSKVHNELNLFSIRNLIITMISVCFCSFICGAYFLHYMKNKYAFNVVYESNTDWLEVIPFRFDRGTEFEVI